MEMMAVSARSRFEPLTLVGGVYVLSCGHVTPPCGRLTLANKRCCLALSWHFLNLPSPLSQVKPMFMVSTSGADVCDGDGRPEPEPEPDPGPGAERTFLSPESDGTLSEGRVLMRRRRGSFLSGLSQERLA